MSKVAKVRSYFNLLKEPYGATGGDRAGERDSDRRPDQGRCAAPRRRHDDSDVLTAIRYLLKLGAIFPPTAPGVIGAGAVIGTLSGAFSIAGYFTAPGDKPNLVGGEFTTAASNLGLDLADRFRQAGNNLDDVGRLMVSDPAKLTEIASQDRRAAEPGRV